MNKPVSSITILGAILKKDLQSYARNKIYLFLTLLGLGFFVLIFWLIPDTVEETITIGITPSFETMIEETATELKAEGMAEKELDFLKEDILEEEISGEEEGIEIIAIEDEKHLKSIVEGSMELYRLEDGQLEIYDTTAKNAEKPSKLKEAEQVDLDIGLAFPHNYLTAMITGGKSATTIYTDAAVPPEVQEAMQGFVREMSFQIAGHGYPVEFPDDELIILGEDRAGAQVSLQEQMRPLLALMVLLLETFAMASLISSEVLQRTITALRVTPMKIGHFLTAKTIFGTALAFSQGVLVLALIGSFTADNWHFLLLVMFLGAVLFTSVAMIIGAAGKDFMGQLMYALLFTVPLMIPAFAVLLPGTAASWVQFIPSYPFVDLLVGITIYETGWAESWGPLIYSFSWVAVLYVIGLLILKRKAESL